jgi:hypothetical protein
MESAEHALQMARDARANAKTGARGAAREAAARAELARLKSGLSGRSASAYADDDSPSGPTEPTRTPDPNKPKKRRL